LVRHVSGLVGLVAICHIALSSIWIEEHIHSRSRGVVEQTIKRHEVDFEGHRRNAVRVNNRRSSNFLRAVHHGLGVFVVRSRALNEKLSRVRHASIHHLDLALQVLVTAHSDRWQ